MKVLKFYASWCGPCKAQTMIINGAEGKLPVPVENVNIDENVFMASNFGVRSIPTMILVDKDEKEIKRHTGVLKEQELIDWMSNK